MTMWTYLLLCCLAAGTVSSSDSSSDSSPASSSTKSNSSLAATPNQLATSFKSFKENFPQPACTVSNAEYIPFSGHLRSLPHSSTIMVQATCSGCNSTVFEQSQVLILVTDAPPFQGKNLMIVLGNEHVFQFIQSGQRYSPSLTFQHNNEIVSVESPQGVTIRDSRRGVTVADLKLFSPTTASVGFVEAQFPQHNITVRYSYNLIWFIRVHLDPTTYRPKQLAGFCGAIVN